MAGPLALVGSGEFLETMRDVDALLLEGRTPKAAVIPTAAALDGAARVQYWLELGRTHFAAMGVEAVAVPALTREDAESAELAALVGDVGLVYLSGGNPGYLADTLRDTALWKSIRATHEAGAALAGCSAGACALSTVSDDFRNPGRYTGRGLGVVPGVAIIPHFDRFVSYRPSLVEEFLAATEPSVTVLGVDENTALVGGPVRFQVHGAGSVWRIGRDGRRAETRPGELLEIEGSPGES